MSEAANVRLVRCPSCHNLLPEVTQFSLYHCGGCGALLRAKKRGVDLETFLEEGDIEKVSDKMCSVSERRMMDMSDGSESDARSTLSSSTRAERRRVLLENDKILEAPEFKNLSIHDSGRRSSRDGYDVGGDLEDRDELLRKLDELQQQLRRSSDKGKEKLPVDMRMYDHWYHNAKRPVFYPPPPPPPYHQMYGAYMDDDGMGYVDHHHHPMEQHHFNRHHPSCSCYQCRNKRQVSAPIRRSPYYPGAREYNHSASVLNPSHGRWPSEVNSEVGDFIHRRPVRPHLSSSAKSCRPLAGGAPFLTCSNCFELLLVPKKLLMKNGNPKKLRCGGCSTVIAVSVSNKSLVVCVEVKVEPVKFDKTQVNDPQIQLQPQISSDDYDHLGYDYHSMDRDSSHQGQENESNEGRETEIPAEKPPAGASLQEYFEYSNKFRVAKDAAEKVLPIKQMLRKESTATEIDLSSNEYANTGTTFDSSEGSREGFFPGMMKKSYKDSSLKYNDTIFEQEDANVTVNGHLIPDRLIRKAAKIAGQIQPGHYWYDFRAGFWGAVGGPCLGIIPPFIEEFNYPMPENCAGGNTGVFVNGRELNEKDMNLLGSRGLPIERDRSYIIEISGRVLDEDTGEELESLGKLAPTVERMKRGFGMRAPRGVS